MACLTRQRKKSEFHFLEEADATSGCARVKYVPDQELDIIQTMRVGCGAA